MENNLQENQQKSSTVPPLPDDDSAEAVRAVALRPETALKFYQTLIQDASTLKLISRNLCDRFNSIQIIFLKDLMIRNNESGFLHISSCKPNTGELVE